VPRQTSKGHHTLFSRHINAQDDIKIFNITIRYYFFTATVQTFSFASDKYLGGCPRID